MTTFESVAFMPVGKSIGPKTEHTKRLNHLFRISHDCFSVTRPIKTDKNYSTAFYFIFVIALSIHTIRGIKMRLISPVPKTNKNSTPITSK